ncbi:MAG: V-type ATP synthase subunit D [bacterium]|nr:V-type ATP synthase subunit D [bacterium]
MKLEVSATRMELLKLKKRILLARRGHKLLKDKQDELMRKFLEYVNRNKILRDELENEMKAFYESYNLVSSRYDLEQLKSFFLLQEASVEVQERIMPVMNLRLPSFTASFRGEPFSTGYKDVDLDMDLLLVRLKEIVLKMVQLAELENNVKELAIEIERTRRRVNALEYILIPNLEETIKYISMKISEVERSNLTRLMKVKEIVEQH